MVPMHSGSQTSIGKLMPPWIAEGVRAALSPQAAPSSGALLVPLPLEQPEPSTASIAESIPLAGVPQDAETCEKEVDSQGVGFSLCFRS